MLCSADKETSELREETECEYGNGIVSDLFHRLSVSQCPVCVQTVRTQGQFECTFV